MLAFENIEAPGWSGQFHENGQTNTLDLAAAHKTTTEYDATLREVRATNPDGSYRTNRYEPLGTWSYDENDTGSDPAGANPQFVNTPMGHFNDGLGRLITVIEAVKLSDVGETTGETNQWITSYQYDLNDQLTRIKDSQGNVKTMAYDGLKRKIFLNDPDRGVIYDVYDDAGNEIETTDAKGQVITYLHLRRRQSISDRGLGNVPRIVEKRLVERFIKQRGLKFQGWSVDASPGRL